MTICHAQGGDVLKKMDAKVVADLLDKSERSADSLPPTPEIGAQTRLQEQTERNSRNVSKTAENLPDSRGDCGGAESRRRPNGPSDCFPSR